MQPEKKATIATVKKAIRQMGLSVDDFTFNRDSIECIKVDMSQHRTEWYTEGNAEIAMVEWALEKLGCKAATTTTGGGWTILYFREFPVSKGDYCDRSSRWHY
jgi:hypothetical protein